MVEKKKLMPREILKQFIKESNLKTAEDAKDLVKELFADTIQELLEAEMDLTSAPYGCRQIEIPPKLD